MLPKFKSSRRSTDGVSDPRKDASRHSSAQSSASSLASNTSKSNPNLRRSSQSSVNNDQANSAQSAYSHYPVTPRVSSNPSRYSANSNTSTSHRASISSLRNDIRSSIYSTDEFHSLSTSKSKQPNEFILERPTDDRIIEEMFKDLIVSTILLTIFMPPQN